MNSYKLTIWSVTVLLLLGVTGFAAKGKNAPSSKAKLTTVKQEKKPATQATPVKPQQPPSEQSTTEAATGEQIDWLVISKGSSQGTSTNYNLGVTVGQNAAGYGTSTNYGLNLGFQQNFGGAGCCQNRGNVDHIISVIGPIDVADLTFLIDYLFRGGDPPPCEDEGNIDAIVSVIGPIDVADLTFLVDFLFRGGLAPPPCL